jgi:hypothetical protein
MISLDVVNASNIFSGEDFMVIVFEILKVFNIAIFHFIILVMSDNIADKHIINSIYIKTI